MDLAHHFQLKTQIIQLPEHIAMAKWTVAHNSKEYGPILFAIFGEFSYS